MEDSENQTPASSKKAHSAAGSKFVRRLGTSGVLIVVLVIAVVAAVFFYVKYQHSQDKLKHPEVVTKAETQTLVEKVGKHVELPTGEQPTIATVSDVSKLANQTFFNGARNGDKVLIYSKARKAVLYRPSEDKVINVAPLNVNNP